MEPGPASFPPAAVRGEGASSPRIGRTRHIQDARISQANSTRLESFCSCEMRAAVDTSAQRKALARKFAPGLLRPFSGMNVSVRLGEIAHNILSRWPIPPQPAKPIANFRYLTMCDRAHWLMLRESLFSLHRSWTSFPEISVVSDGTWTVSEFADVFGWW